MGGLFGLPLYAISGKPSVAPVSPSTLALTGWWNWNWYDGFSTWYGSSSTGTSGSHDLGSDGAPPGYDGMVDFDAASSERLIAIDTAEDFIGLYAGTFSFLIKPRSATAFDNANWPYNAMIIAVGNPGNPPELAMLYVGDNGSLGVTGVLVYANGDFVGPISVPTGSWSVVDCRLDGGLTQVRVNGGAWASNTAYYFPDFTGMSMFVGCDPTKTYFYDGHMAELLVNDTALTDAQLNGVYAYFKSTYPSAGLP